MMKINERKMENPKLHKLVTDFAMKFYDEFVTKDGIKVTPLTTKNQNDDGVYGWKVNGGSDTIGETGRSFVVRGKERLDGKPDDSTAQVRERMSIVYTTQQCVEIMDMPQFKSLYEEIADMYHPRLHFHAEKKEKRKEKLSRQIIEGVVAATSRAFNYDAFECLTNYPSDEIQQILSIPDPNQDCANVTRAAKTIIPFFTWGTNGSYIHELMRMMACGEDGKALSSDQLELLHRIVRDPHPDGFLQNQKFKCVIGGNNVEILQYVNGVDSKDNPRTKELFKVVGDLKSLLTEDFMGIFCEDEHIPQDIKDEVNKILNDISKSDYQSPDDDALQAAYKEGLLELHGSHKDCGDEVIIVTEVCVFDALDDDTHNILFPDGSKTFVQLDCDCGEVAERVIQTPNGPNFKIMHSSHIAFGENSTRVQR